MKRICFAVALTLAAIPSFCETPSINLVMAGRFPQPTDKHGSAVVGDRFYLISGHMNRSGPSWWLKTVSSAKINPDATLGHWRDEQPLPEPRFYIGNMVQVVGNSIYVIGGRVARAQNGSESDSTRANDVLYGQINERGGIKKWERSSPYPGKALSNAATCSRDGQLFIVGGNDDAVSANIIAADISPGDGAPTNWRSAGKLPFPLWFHGAAILGNRMYVWGGAKSLDDKKTNTDVRSAPLSSDGKIGEWRTEQSMQSGISGSGFCGINDYLICAAGRYNQGYGTNVIWFSKLNNGIVGPWTMVKTDIEGYMYLSVGIDKLHGWAFVNGGQIRPGLDLSESYKLVDAVQVFQLPQASAQKMVVDAPQR